MGKTKAKLGLGARALLAVPVCLRTASLFEGKGGKVLQSELSQLLFSPFPCTLPALPTLPTTNLLWRNIGKKLNSKAGIGKFFSVKDQRVNNLGSVAIVSDRAIQFCCCSVKVAIDNI